MRFATLAMIASIAVSIAGCATDPIFRNDCDWAKSIKPSRADVLSRQTKEQIADHNEIGARLCGWRP